jgi:hypothetical protein
MGPAIPLLAHMCMMGCVEDDPYVKYEVEDFQDLEQQQALIEGKSFLHPHFSYCNVHFNYTVIYLLHALM